ncbi:hypothetical protein H5410_058257 [Solanum commersonii]|uniref:Uncharacterized protein n=1 Tax=Solanum commersonii TaxID=4109 RepID=A0A9J5WQ78_SOLCO|nr:hypothetical protein H5410_058257 [Solanum commersonii]
MNGIQHFMFRLELIVSMADRGMSANTSTSGPTSRIAGARMKTARKLGGPPSSATTGGIGSSVSKL